MRNASLLFDLDNTLINRDAAFHAYIQSFINRNRYAFSDENKALAHAEIMAMDCHGKRDRKVFCLELLQRFPRLLYTEESLWADHMSLPDFVNPDKVVNEMLGQLAANHQLLIISNGSADMQHRKIQQACIAEFFEHTFISGEVGYEKPDLRFFAHALTRCNRAEKIMVGDDYINDMQPAMALQLKTVYINTEATAVPIKPDVELTSIHALEGALACMT